ncbi:MAG: hypothetical protein NTY89_24155 [Nostocales cyanobacterium LacPavin_0920_SED1_MAG_38_18]|nr:hypothetical protein [Nostocales cyanobacterium LacPavin_0920_SED1_MAG_38_18]
MTVVNLQIPFESLIAAISSLNLQEKHQLLEFLEEQLLEDEEDLIEQNPQIMSEVAESRKAYQNGDYQTIQEYIANQNPQIS